jgi:hydroxymethylbilane synthase
LGTRGSALALGQAHEVAGRLRARYPDVEIAIVTITTTGDRVTDVPLTQIGGAAGVFTGAVEAALRAGEVDIAVHSLKDLPTYTPAGVRIAAILPRADARDVLVSRHGVGLDALPSGAVIGTSSRRRAAQLLYRRRDLQMADMRGNVDTRLAKGRDPAGMYDAIILARAGLDRLGRADAITETLSFDVSLPAPGQGALAVQCRDERAWIDWLQPIHHHATGTAVTAERAFLSALGGGCALPIGAYGTYSGVTLNLRGRVTAADGSTQIDVGGTVIGAFATVLGIQLAIQVMQRGGMDWLKGDDKRE